MISKIEISTAGCLERFVKQLTFCKTCLFSKALTLIKRKGHIYFRKQIVIALQLLLTQLIPEIKL